MQLEFHQLDRGGEHLRVQHPQQQKRLLASLGTSGQQTPIVVVAVTDQPNRYHVIDGYKRIAALQQLGRDTVEAVVCSHGHFDHTTGLDGLSRAVGRANLPVLVHPEFWSRRRIALPGREPWELPATSRGRRARSGSSTPKT